MRQCLRWFGLLETRWCTLISARAFPDPGLRLTPVSGSRYGKLRWPYIVDLHLQRTRVILPTSPRLPALLCNEFRTGQPLFSLPGASTGKPRVLARGSASLYVRKRSTRLAKQESLVNVRLSVSAHSSRWKCRCKRVRTPSPFV